MNFRNPSPAIALAFLLAACHTVGGDLTSLDRDDQPIRRQEALVRLAVRAGKKNLNPEGLEQTRAAALKSAEDDSPLVRSAAMHCLAVIGGDAAAAKLAGTAASDEEPYVRADALAGLAALATPVPPAATSSAAGTAAALERALREDRSPLVKRMAVQLAEGLADKDAARRVLELAAGGTEPGLAFQARKALDRLGTESP